MFHTSSRKTHPTSSKPSSKRKLAGGGGLEYIIHYSASNIDHQAWNELNRAGNAFLDPLYLGAISKGLKEWDQFRFIQFYSEIKVVGIAIFHLTRFEAQEGIGSDKSMNMASVMSKLVNRHCKIYNVMVCGNAFSTGEHGYLFSNEISSKLAMESLCFVLSDVLKEEKEDGKRISAVVVKDFCKAHYNDVASLKDQGFMSFAVDHSMVMQLLPEWKTFTDYLDSMNTKFRTKAKGAYIKSRELEEVDADDKGLLKYSAALMNLYQQVYCRAEFKLGKMSFEAFYEMKKALGNRMIVRMYLSEGIPVGFLSAILTSGKLEAYFVGIDYSVNHRLALYSRMLYDFVKIGIANSCDSICFGRTAGEMKSAVGAVPEEMMCCFKHPSRISNFLFKWLFTYVKPSEFPMKYPFKRITQQKLQAERELRTLSELSP